ncbi:MAG: hypothetical protein ACOC5T_09630 [Elusimicrobiota bacterium]
MIATGTLQGTYSGVYPEDVRMIPIKKVPKSEQKPLISLVDKMLNLKKQLKEIGNKKTDKRTKIEKEIKKTDKKINNLVYKSYGLTKKEINIIEESLEN